MNYNSVKNQSIKGKFVEREVFACVSELVDYIIKQGWDDVYAPFCYDDIENGYVYRCPECGYKTVDFSEFEYECPDCETVLSDMPEPELQEIYEWWICSSWLIGKLKEKGEPVLEDECIWGRCTTGQAILLDGVISEICSDMGILEGQKFEWEV